MRRIVIHNHFARDAETYTLYRRKKGGGGSWEQQKQSYTAEAAPGAVKKWNAANPDYEYKVEPGR